MTQWNGTCLSRVTCGRLKPPGTVGRVVSISMMTNSLYKLVFTVFRKSRVGRFLTQNALWYMEKFRMVPKGTYDVGESLIYTQAALVKGGQTKLFT